jgi:methyl-accepting chemotaxis protein
MRRSWIVAIVVLAMAGIAAGCGGDDESDADPTAAWASDFCTAVTTWKDELESIKSDFSSPSDLSEESIKSAAEEAKSATETLRDTLRDLGAPDTASGEEVRDAVDSVSNTVEDEAEKIQDAAEGVSSITDLPAAISTITTSVSAILTAGSEARQTVEDADVDGELRTAFESSPECDDLSSS